MDIRLSVYLGRFLHDAISGSKEDVHSSLIIWTVIWSTHSKI